MLGAVVVIRKQQTRPAASTSKATVIPDDLQFDCLPTHGSSVCAELAKAEPQTTARAALAIGSSEYTACKDDRR